MAGLLVAWLSTTELRNFENLAPEQEPEPLKFSRLHQPWISAFSMLTKLKIFLDSQLKFQTHIKTIKQKSQNPFGIISIFKTPLKNCLYVLTK